MSNKDHNEDHLITDEEIAQTLLALNDASMDIPEDLHSEVGDLETDTQKALQEALEQQEILKRELEKYQQKEADEKNLANLKEIAQSELEKKGFTQDKNESRKGSNLQSAGDDPTQAPHKPTVVRVSTTGQVLNSKGEVVAVDRRSSDRGESVNVTTKRKFS
ncbi:MAG: hypothetical protein KBS85_00245, partial [Lachnospiraceae bacterium]|nr:hypothetical protein [Candidatus Merdinaster equi]